MEIYSKNNLNYTLKKYRAPKEINKLIPYLKNDKKNDDEKINFILLNRIGKTSQPNKYKISVKELKRKLKFFNQEVEKIKIGNRELVPGKGALVIEKIANNENYEIK